MLFDKMHLELHEKTGTCNTYDMIITALSKRSGIFEITLIVCIGQLKEF